MPGQSVDYPSGLSADGGEAREPTTERVAFEASLVVTVHRLAKNNGHWGRRLRLVINVTDGNPWIPDEPPRPGGALDAVEALHLCGPIAHSSGIPLASSAA